MRVLAITQIWPNSVEPLSSPFNSQQFRALASRCDLRVLAAVAHVPGARHLPPRLGARPKLLSGLPARETVHGIETVYMRQLYVPKVGVPVAVPLYLASLLPHRALLEDADVILGTWAYPDGCAATLAARAFGKPCAVKVHGSDLNVIAKMPSARAVIRKVLPRADALVSVSRPLSDLLSDLGVSRSRIHLVANGVNAELFAPFGRGAARKALGLSEAAKIVLFVGRLEPQKGVDELLPAWQTVRAAHPDATLVLIGEGVSTNRVAEAASAAQGSIVAKGPRPLAEVARWLAACDVFTLPSWMEGTPNVVLEALATGRPVVASSVGGVPDLLADPRVGTLVPPRDAVALGAALSDALARRWDEAVIHRAGPQSWDASGAALHDVLTSIAGRARVEA